MRNPHVGAISTNKTIRRQQFRDLSRDILDRARTASGTTDRLGALATAMERAYAAGASNVGYPEETPAAAGYVWWGAIPSRSRDILQSIAHAVLVHRDEIRAGRILAVLKGAREVASRGQRAEFFLLRKDGNDTVRRLETSSRHEWAASSASALVRLGVFETSHGRDDRPTVAVLTALGLTTIEACADEGHILTLERAMG